MPRGELIKGVGEGLRHLHSCEIVHGDLKAENVLVDEDGVPRICDFGMATIVERELPNPITSSLKRGSYRWMAPERISPRDFSVSSEAARTFASDIYSLGMTIYEIMSGGYPFPKDSDLKVMALIMGGERPTHPGLEAERRGLGEQLWRFVELCWAAKKESRPTIDELFPALEGNYPAIMLKPVVRVTDTFGCREDAPVEFRKLLETSDLDLLQAVVQGNEAIGLGVVSEVWLGVLGRDGRLVAIKELRVRTHTFALYKELLARLSTATQLRHPNILPVLGICPNWRLARFAVLSEYMQGGDLASYHEHCPEDKHLQLLSQVAEGLNFLHSQIQTLVHGELTPSDILITNEGKAMLRSFSVQSCVDPFLDENSGVGRFLDVRWLAPERINFQNFGMHADTRLTQSDVYTFGLIVYHVLFHRIPFEGTTNTLSLIHLSQQQKRPDFAPEANANAVGRGMSPEIQSFVVQCWMEDYRKRPKIGDFLLLLRTSLSVPIAAA